MELRKLQEGEMGEISRPWVTPGNPLEDVIAKRPMLAALLPALTGVHNGIVAVTGQSNDPAARALSIEANRLDAQHDELLCTLFDTFTVTAKTSKAGAEILQLRDTLFPEKKMHTKKSHGDEAGYAAALAKSVSADVLARMKSLPVGDMTVFDLYSQYQETAKQLGAVNEKRARANQQAVTPAAQVQAARREWIRWTKIFMETAANAGLDAETDALLFGPLREAVERADSRWHTKPPVVPAPAPAK